MANKGDFTRLLAGTGTALVWFPVLAPVLLGSVVFLQTRQFWLDYLMPGELFLVALAGGMLLLWAALRARARRVLIGTGFGLAVGLLLGGQVLAAASGLALGETRPEGLAWALVLASLAGYVLALIGTGVGGILLLGDLRQPGRA